MRIEPLGDSALLVRPVDEFDPDQSLDVVQRATEALNAAALPGVVELVPTYTTVAVFFDRAHEFSGQLEGRIESLLREDSPARARDAATIEVPVCYEDDFALDLDEVSRHTGLARQEIVQRHSDASYRVSCVGFTPGFPYLSGLPAELATPRRASPRKETPAGAVAIGGTQTGIYPRKSPGGWNIIGRTPLRLFDVTREPPALFRAGDRVLFRRISRQEFDTFAA
jgi:KipI family sensor histidine kinase inhibitor